jgi:hypothetical protein
MEQTPQKKPKTTLYSLLLDIKSDDITLEEIDIIYAVLNEIKMRKKLKEREFKK